MNCIRLRLGQAFALSLVALIASPINAQDDPLQGLGFGDIPLSQEDYDANILSVDTLFEFNKDAQSVAELDARTRGWVTPAKHQGVCGSCWAFATVGTIEARVLKDFGVTLDLSEQQLVSCHSGAYGCCGGSGSALKFFYQDRPNLESAAPYSESNTACPTQRSVQCSSISGQTYGNRTFKRLGMLRRCRRGRLRPSQHRVVCLECSL